MSSLLRLLLSGECPRGAELAALPRRGGPRGAKKAFLLVHGFTGIPSELSAMGEALAEAGSAYAIPRLPGHGTGRADFLATGAGDWLRRVVDSYQELRAEFETVDILGYSMGGLLAAIAAAAFDAPRLILLAPAFRLARPVAAVAPLVAPFAPVIRVGRPNEETDPGRQRLFEDYWADDLVSGAAQLIRLQGAGRRALPLVRSRILVVAGSEDDTVPPSIGRYVARRAGAAASVESRVVEGEGHSFPFGPRAEEAALILRDWAARA